jgi:hypothetical protein
VQLNVVVVAHILHPDERLQANSKALVPAGDNDFIQCSAVAAMSIEQTDSEGKEHNCATIFPGALDRSAYFWDFTCKKY